MKRVIFWNIAILTLLVLAVAAFRAYEQRQIAKRIAITSPNGIASLEKVRLGGVDQWIQIRSHDRSKPIVLFLHSGPGFPELPFSHLNAALEKEFVMRAVGPARRGQILFVFGSGKLNDDRTIHRRHARASATSLATLRAHEVNSRRAFRGSIVGALTVAKYPDLFEAYVAISQAVNAPESERMMYRFALESATRQGNDKAVADLRRIGEPPYKSFGDYRLMKGWVKRFNDVNYAELTPWQFARIAFTSPSYSWRDLFRLLFGMRFSFSRLWEETFYRIDLFKQVPRIDVPIYFFLGRHDRTVTASAALAEQYFDALDTPKGKHLIWFENSGHWPQLEEPERFRAALLASLVREVARSPKE